MLAALGKGPGTPTPAGSEAGLEPTIFVKHNSTRYIKNPISSDTFSLWPVPECVGLSSANSGPTWTTSEGQLCTILRPFRTGSGLFFREMVNNDVTKKEELAIILTPLLWY